MACGRKETIAVTKGKKIKNKKWFYFGKVNLNADKIGKYAYECIFDKKGKFHGETKKVINPYYDKTAKPHLIEYWECKTCANDWR